MQAQLSAERPLSQAVCSVDRVRMCHGPARAIGVLCKPMSMSTCVIEIQKTSERWMKQLTAILDNVAVLLPCTQIPHGPLRAANEKMVAD